LPLGKEVPADVRLVVDMTAEFPRMASTPASVDYLCLPTLDASAPDLARCEALVRRIYAHPGPVYIHCAQGHGRSAVVAGALLYVRGVATTADDAIARMKRHRPGINLSSSQRAALAALCSRLADAQRCTPCQPAT
jgi:protein-tyrosine phosphatase